MAAMMAVGVARTRAQGQNTTRIVHSADDFPADEPGEDGSGEGDDDDPGRPPVRDSHDLCFSGISRLDEADHTLNGTVLPYLGGGHIEGAKLVDRTAGYLVAHTLCPRAGIPRS